LTNNDLTYTITVTNLGPNPASNAQVSDPLPPNTTFQSVTSNCTPLTVGGTGTVRCTLGTLPASGSATITLVVHVNVAGGGSVTNTATVTSDTLDPNLLNNSQTITTTVNP
jgi:uncharacterized repeat protein (TIGR01451 family)